VSPSAPTDLSALPEAARAFAEGEVDLLPGVLAAADLERLVALLCARGDGARLQRLSESRDKNIAKPARKGLNLLRTRGAAVPVAPKREFRAVGPYAPEAETPSLVSMIDGRGERIVWLVRPAHDGSGYVVYQAEVSESRGLIGFAVGQVARKEWRLHARRVVDDPRLIVGEVSSAHARWRIELGYQRTLAAGRVVPEAFANASIELGPAEAPAHHPALDLYPPHPIDEVRGQLAGLHERVEVKMWIPERDSLEALDVRIGEIATSTLVLDPGQRREQLAVAIEHAADQALTPEYRALLADRLYETALLVGAHGRVEDARLLTTVAALTLDPGVGAAGNPFVLRLYDKLIDPKRVEAPQP